MRVIFLQQSKRAAVRLSTTCYRFPLLCDCGFAHAGYSPSQHVHQIQEVSELPCVCGRATAHPAGSVSTLLLACRGGASRKPFLHNLLFRPKQGVAQSLAEKSGVAVAPVCCWAKRGGSCHRGKSSSPKPAPLGPLGSCCPRGAARSPPAIRLALPFSMATYIYFFYMLHWEREEITLQSCGCFNKRLTSSASSFKSVKLLLCLIINICVVVRTLRFQRSPCLNCSQLSIADLKLRSVFMHRTLGETKIENIQGTVCFRDDVNSSNSE